MAASLALGVSVLEIKGGLDARVVRTVLPAGTVLGRAGSVAHLAVSLIFLAHLHRAKIEGWDLLGTGANAVVASLTDSGASPALVTVLLGGKAGSGDPIMLAAESILAWLTAMADTYGNCVAATVCHDIVEGDLSEDDVCGSEEG
ncbi:putative sodium-dependent excitatory amino acid transporter glt-3 [Amblyomma americanum]